ncbi:hypothetical protein [Deefgea salmonis]|uniref:Uncharacterized protein n=1 Tax=Deefgea salmonis TaxID=2875502 RepID=A0ABS8BJH4_9NEIS|nr:hypothetical protein [Deefgea salmonis]MCB5195721.1 hypothetical protein [Deefgea salmonis]
MLTQHQHETKHANGGIMVFYPLYQAERGTSGAGFLRSLFEAAGRVLSATASIVRSEGTDEVGADTGGCFGVKGALQKQRPLPARAAERAPKPRGAAA